MRLLSSMILIAAAIALASCGKAGKPVPPEGAAQHQFYPSKALGPIPADQKEGRGLPPEWDQQDLDEAYGEGVYLSPVIKHPLPPGLKSVPSSQPGFYGDLGSEMGPLDRVDTK